MAAASATRSSLRWLRLPISAYRAALASDEDGFYVLTEGAAYRMAPEHAPVKLELDLGFGATSTRSSFVYWSSGAVLAADKQSGRTRRLGVLAERPRAFIASEDEIAWIEGAESGHFALRTFVGGAPRTAYASPGTIDAGTMLSDWIFFVERPSEGTWRIGGVRAAGGAPVFTSPRSGRAPAMLVGRGDLYYYDGTTREVRRLAPDLKHEETLAKDCICSPLAAAGERVFCARVEGIFELGPGQAPRQLASLQGPVADLAANGEYVAWIADAGRDALEVRALRLERRAER